MIKISFQSMNLITNIEMPNIEMPIITCLPQKTFVFAFSYPGNLEIFYLSYI